MKLSFSFSSRIVLCIAAGLLAGCQTERGAFNGTALQEVSVRPGINESYLQPNLDPTQWVERFENEGREVYDHRHQIVEAVRVRPGSQVADIGSGTGLFVSLFAEAVGSRGKVYAVDIVPAFLELIDNRVEAAGIRNVETVLCTERSVELPAHSIDVAFLCDVYHHFEFPQSSLASIHRALRRNGELFLVEFKRIPGVSSDWILDHVRAGQETFEAEIESAGFEKVEEFDFLRENYLVRFRKK
jgi:SAM-dependent methyltransferase